MAVLSSVIVCVGVMISLGWSQVMPEDSLAREKTSKGMAYYRSVLENRPDLPEAHFGAGWEAYQTQDYPYAERAFENSVQTDRPDLRSRAFYNLGNALYQQGRFLNTLQAYRKALELDPGDRDAKHNYELALNMIRNPPARGQSQSQGESNEREDSPEPRENVQEDSERQSRGTLQDKSAQTRDADAILDALEANDRNLMKRRWKNPESVTLEKDW